MSEVRKFYEEMSALKETRTALHIGYLSMCGLNYIILGAMCYMLIASRMTMTTFIIMTIVGIPFFVLAMIASTKLDEVDKKLEEYSEIEDSLKKLREERRCRRSA